jgi:hypothetical protein
VFVWVFLFIPQVGLLAACGPLPRPFEHQRINGLLNDQRALAPLLVQRIDGAPNLAEAISAGLNREEIAASTDIAGRRFQILSGTIRSENGAVLMIWEIIGDDGRVIDEIRQPLQPNFLDPAHQDAFVEAAVHTIVRALRGDDSGVADLDASPHVALRSIKTPPNFDGESLSSAMRRALALQGLTLVSTNPAFVIDGNLRIAATVAGQNQVAVDWTVQDASGRQLGTVSQSSPVPHDRLLGPLTGLSRDIAFAGAEGIRDVIRGQPTK